MPLPSPEPGLVVHYEFLWSNENEAGQTDGEKQRPAVIVVATKIDGNKTEVIVAPITHSPPRGAGIAIEIPPKVKTHLGLDNQRSWVTLDELNEFVWPGYDLYPVPNTPPGTFAYGYLPPVLFIQIRDRILALDAALKSLIQR